MRLPLQAIERLIVVAVVVAASLAGSPGTARADTCAKVASPTGRDSAAGTLSSPYRTVERLADALDPGETGCLRGGDYVEDDVDVRVADTTLTSYRGERARVVGRLRVVADGVTVERVALDSRSADLPGPAINADDVTFRDNDVSGPGGPGCFILGSVRQVLRPRLEGNRIHDCGDPSTVVGHGVYMQNVVGARLSGNWIYDNADRGIKVGPDADESTIRGNVIDGNAIGLNFSGSGTHVSSRNVVERNVISYSTRWWNVQSYWPDDVVGTGNEVRYNCLYGGNPDPDYNENGGVSDGAGFTAHDNVVAEPRFVDRAAKDFRLRLDSRCEAVFDGCAKVASPTGSDSAPGTLERPFETVQRLADSLDAGQTGCLRSGTYADGDVTLRERGVRLTRYPGDSATIRGRLRVTGDGVVVDHLGLDGRNDAGLPSPTINADDVTFRSDRVSAAGQSSCFMVGTSGAARDTLIERSRIRDCGDATAGVGDGIVLQDAEGARILRNVIYDNGRRGVTLTTGAHGALVRGNVIDGNGTGVSFFGDADGAAADDVVEHNVISNSTRSWNVQSVWADGVPAVGNEVRSNCVYASNPDEHYRARGGIDDGPGFTAHDNLVANPRFVDRADGDFTLRDDSPCRAVF